MEELKALVLILREDPYALAFYIFLFLFLLCLELLVVTSKTGDSKCDYDLVVEHQLRIKAETLRNTELSLLNKQKDPKNITKYINVPITWKAQFKKEYFLTITGDKVHGYQAVLNP